MAVTDKWVSPRLMLKSLQDAQSTMRGVWELRAVTLDEERREIWLCDMTTPEYTAATKAFKKEPGGPEDDAPPAALTDTVQPRRAVEELEDREHLR
jgi:hypothetical protein